jgi:hypothetical protein
MKSTNLPQLQAAIDESKSWVEVARIMGRSPSSGDMFKQIAEKHGLSHDHLVSHMAPVANDDSADPYPVSVPDRLAARRSAIGVAIAWFLGKGYKVALPVEVEKYDLVVESALGFRKVQVKSAEKENQQVSLLTTTYDSVTSKYVQRPYLEDEIDDFFVVCANGENYLVPQNKVAGKRTAMLSTKYRDFLV